jgi:uncharacterized protein YdhG (YjbR/CyaY superfamily)
MAERKPVKKGTQKSAKSTTATGKTSKRFTAEERAAMKERAQELKAEARRGPRAAKADGEGAVLAKIAEMPGPDRAMAKRLHAIVKASAPALSPKTWYGMPAYARDGKVVCFFQSAQVQIEVGDVRLQRRGEPRPRRHVADLLRADEVDRRRRGKDRCAREDSGELRTEFATPRAALSRPAMSMATRTDTQSLALHVAERHEPIRVHGARENNVEEVTVEIPKGRLTLFTGVSCASGSQDGARPRARKDDKQQPGLAVLLIDETSHLRPPCAPLSNEP